MSDTATAETNDSAPAIEADAPIVNGPEITTAAPAEGETPADPPVEEAKPSRTERRIATLSARLSAGEQERAALIARLAAYEKPAADRTPPAAADIPRLVEQEVNRRETEARVADFHKAGKAACTDWADRCQSLVEMGADAQMSELLVEIPDGAKVAVALADDPDELERIVALKTERARAIALGKYAATLAAKPAAPGRQVSRAPAPITPITGGARTAFNESTATADQLVEHYAKQERARRGL